MRPVRQTPKNTMTRCRIAVKDPIVVDCRVRPLDDPAGFMCIRVEDDNKTVVLTPPETSQSGKIIKETKHSFNHVFDEESTQKEVFDQAALPLVEEVLQGGNGLLFAYGVTSSGKTYTMTGSPKDCGILPRCLDVIFNSIRDCQTDKYVIKPDKLNGFDIQTTAEAMQEQQKDLGLFCRTPKVKRKELSDSWSGRIPETSFISLTADVKYAVFISFVEIYNNYIYDLLEDTVIDQFNKKPSSKMLREDAGHNMYVFGAVESEATSVEEALQLFYKGQQRRKVAETALNRESSRSHSVFTIRVVQVPLNQQGSDILQDKNIIIVSQLSLVDLSGSERQSRTKAVGAALREASSINNSLMTLRQCIEALRESQTQAASKNIPYRDSKLTHLFKTFFDGEGKMTMIVCVNPRDEDYDENTKVMNFAETTQEVLISRPTQMATPTTLGLRVGRGVLFRDAAKRARELNVPVDEVLAPTVYSLGPDFPPLNAVTSNDEGMYSTLIEFLSARISRRGSFTLDLIRRQDDFRNNLVEVDKENIQLKQEKTILQMDLNAREQQVRGLERKISSAEQMVDALERQLNEFRQRAENQRLELETKDRHIANIGDDIDNLKVRMHEKLASEKGRLKRIMERRLAAKQAEIERKMCFTDERFRQLREILNADDWEFGDFNIPVVPVSTTSTATSESSVPDTRRTRRRSQSDSKFTKVKSAVNIPIGSSQPQSNQQNDFDDLYAKENKAPGSSQRSMAISNLRHRRSQSSSADVWIEHKPVGNLDLNTVLQPKMKKKKSVSKLTVKDVTNDASKYVLQHQEQDSQGEVETQLYKGDIIPSAGGGAQVVFSDVEKLKQASPPSLYNLRKRTGDSLPLRTVEDRCTVSVECHGLPSKIMKKK